MEKQNFNEWLDEELKKRSWNKAELARRAHISQSALSMIKSGEREPGLEILTSIAHALKESPENVYRIAGLLPPIDQDDSDLEDFRELLKNLTPEERAELKAIGWLKVDMKKKK
jgi:transcriptional regulator with XRE-family HTH domain